jgi:ribosomal protein L11 methyltransferase
MEQQWLECTIDTAPGCLEDLAAYLTACGIEGLVLEEESDFDSFADENRPFWDDVDEALRQSRQGVTRATFYVTADEEGRARLDEVTAGLPAFRARLGREAGSLAVNLHALQEEDWSQNWKKYYQPFPVGQRLYVVPEWLRQEPVPEGRLPLYLNPGLIFGTGSHGTTRLCMEGVERYLRPGDRVLDLGTGSGILAIAALRLGASQAKGCDIDPKAVDVAAENAAYNGIHEEFQVYIGDITKDAALQQQLAGRYQLVVANIVADVIIPLCAVAGDYLAPGGTFLTSGILEGRASEVETALSANGFTLLERQERDGWVSFAATKG